MTQNKTCNNDYKEKKIKKRKDRKFNKRAFTNFVQAFWTLKHGSSFPPAPFLKFAMADRIDNFKKSASY